MSRSAARTGQARRQHAAVAVGDEREEVVEPWRCEEST